MLSLDFCKGWELAVPSHYVEKKQGFSYLSWMYAIHLLNKEFPGVQVAFEECPATNGPVWYEQGVFLVNYCKNSIEGRMAYLRPYLTDGNERTPALYFPVMDARKNAAINPCPRVVNDNIQRAISKCISTYTGIGAKLYVGEDLEHLDEAKPAPAAQAPVMQAEPTLGDDPKLQAWFHAQLTELGLNDHGRETMKIVMGIESTNSFTKSKADAIISRLSNKEVVEKFNQGIHPQSGEVVNAVPVPKGRKKKTAKEVAEQLADQFDGEVVIPEEMPI